MKLKSSLPETKSFRNNNNANAMQNNNRQTIQQSPKTTISPLQPTKMRRPTTHRKMATNPAMPANPPTAQQKPVNKRASLGNNQTAVSPATQKTPPAIRRRNREKAANPQTSRQGKPATTHPATHRTMLPAENHHPTKASPQTSLRPQWTIATPCSVYWKATRKKKLVNRQATRPAIHPLKSRRVMIRGLKMHPAIIPTTAIKLIAKQMMPPMECRQTN